MTIATSTDTHGFHLGPPKKTKQLRRGESRNGGQRPKQLKSYHHQARQGWTRQPPTASSDLADSSRIEPRLLDFSTSLESREPRRTLGAIRIGPPSPESRLCHCCRRIDQRYPRCHCLMFRTPGKSLASPMMGSTRLGNASTSIFQKPSHVARSRPRLHPAKQSSGSIKERLDGWDNASKGSRPSSVTPSSYSDPQITQGAQALVP